MSYRRSTEGSLGVYALLHTLLLDVCAVCVECGNVFVSSLQLKTSEEGTPMAELC